MKNTSINIDREKDTISKSLLIGKTPQIRRRVQANDFKYFGDSLLHGYSEKLKFYFKKYSNENCVLQEYDDSSLRADFDQPITLGYLNQNKIKDSVFVLPELNVCEEGDSYYFSDTTIPRLQTESVCCHPDNIFLVGDIDEDGISEIGQYYSSCVSHYKSLWVWTLKKGKWVNIGQCVFDLSFEKPDMKKRIRKIGKAKFEMLEITDLGKSEKYGKKGRWIKFSF